MKKYYVCREACNECGHVWLLIVDNYIEELVEQVWRLGVLLEHKKINKEKGLDNEKEL